MDILQIKEKLPKDFYDRYNLLYGSAEEEKKRSGYLLKIVENLFPAELDFNRYPVYFCIVDSREADATFISPDSSEWKNVSVVMLTNELFSLVQNEDQLAFVLGREIILLQKFFNQTVSSAGYEQNDLDFVCLERMAKAGYNINEAGKLITHILINGQKYDALATKLSQTFKPGQDNEKRINTINFKIGQLETSYLKQNKNLNAVEVRKIPDSIKESIFSAHHIPTFQQLLLEQKYDRADLAAKQDILVRVIKNYIINDCPSEFSEYKHRQIQEAIINYVVELRHEMPAHLLSLGNYNLLTGNSPQDENIRKQLWKEATHHDMPESISLRKKFLQAFPIRIIPDENFVEAKEKNNFRKTQQQKEILSGDNLNVLFWEKLVELETSFADTPNIAKLSEFNGFVLSGINDIDLTKIQTGRLILNVLEKLVDGHTQIDATGQNLLSAFLHIRDRYDVVGIPTPLLPGRMRFYNIHKPRIFKKFNAKNFPELSLQTSANAVGSSIPVRILSERKLASIFGVTVKEISSNLYVVGYNSNYKNTLGDTNESNADWFYIADKDGQIIDSFSAQQKNKKVSALLDSAENDIYQKLAAKVKTYYEILQDILKNPETDKYSVDDLWQLKKIVSARNADCGTYKISELEYYREINKEKSSRVKRNRQDIKALLERDFQAQKYESGFDVSIGAFDINKLKQLLTPEITAFVQTPYNEHNDDAVFNAYLQKLRAEFLSDQDIWNDNLADFKEDRLLPDYKSALSNPHNSKYLTEPQLVKYYRTLIENVGKERLMQHSVLIRERVVLPELKHIAAFAAEQLEKQPDKTLKDIDYKSYQPLYADKIAKLFDFPADFAQFTQTDIFDLPDGRGTNLQMSILLYLLTSDKPRFPLAVLANHPLHDLSDLQTAKLTPFLKVKENYPKDTVDMVDTYQKLYDCKLVDFSETAEFIIQQIKREPNPQKALMATLKMSEIICRAGDNTHKDLLLKDNPAFDTGLFGKITAYQKLSAAGAFADDYVMQNRMLESFIPEIEAVQEADVKNSYYDIFISKHHRIADPDLRRRYQQLWVQSAFAACGSKIDDNSAELHAKIRHFTDKLNGHYITSDMFKAYREDNVNPADRIEIAQILAERFVAQQKLSALLKPQPATYVEMSLNADGQNFQTAGFAFIRNYIKENPEATDKIIDFLTSKGTVNDCQNLYQQLQNANQPIVSAQTLHVLYREFWTCPTEARGVFFYELVLDAQPYAAEGKCERPFDRIVKRLFAYVEPPMFETASHILKQYTMPRPITEQAQILTAMMEAAIENSETTDPHKCLAKGFRLFLEKAGPEMVKIGQTLAAYTDMPKYIRDEFLKLKLPVIRPPRWEIFEWIDSYQSEEKNSILGDDTEVWLGKFVTSSLYFVTLEKGKFQNGRPPFESDKIIKLLRAGAKVSADREFKILENTFHQLAEKNLINVDLDRFLSLIRRTKEKLNIEIDIQTGYEQFKAVQRIYDNKKFKANDYTFKIHIADWIKYGKSWAEMDYIKGYELEKIKNLRYRQAAANICFSLEAMNLLSGGRFYHERFGFVLRFDTDNNVINLVDIGAAPIVPPVPADKELLGAVIYRTLERFMNDKADINGFRKMSVILNSEIIKAYHERQTISSYLQECQRGLLALAEFYTDFSSQDFIDSLYNALNNPDLPFDAHIMRGFIAEGIKNIGIFASEQPLLSDLDKEKLGSFLFDVYTSALTDGSIKTGNVIKKEIIKMRQKAEKGDSLLKIISEKIKDLDKDSLSLDLPKEFMPTIGELIVRQNVDSSILKGIMKEVIYTVSLEENDEMFSAEDRQEFGRLLYDTFSFIVSESQQGKNADMADTYLMLHKSGNYHSEYAARIAAIVEICRTVGLDEKHHGVDTENAVKSVILSGKMDKEIVKGTAETFRSRNPNSLTRSVVAKGLELFLTQKQATSIQLKKALVKIFVKKKNALPVLDRDIMTALENPSNRIQIARMMQIYIQKLGGRK